MDLRPCGASAPNLTSLAREGDHPPGTPDGTRFVGIFFGDDLIPAFERPSLNSAGQVAFKALTTGPLGEYGRGIWATDLSGNLRLIAHTGDDFVVAPGDVPQIELLKLNSGGSSEEGYLSAFNDAGQLAFAVSFTDTSEGVVIASIVPEPSSVALLLVATCCVTLGVSRKRFPGLLDDSVRPLQRAANMYWKRRLNLVPSRTTL